MVDSNPETDLAIRDLLDGVFEHYRLDFRDYALSSMRRRILACVAAERVGSVPDLHDLVLRDAGGMDRLLVALTVHVTSMFRDPGFYRAFRAKVVPLLRAHPFVRIWHAGCSTGEEIYSMAILLREEGLYERCRIYATDMSESALRQAHAGVFPLSSMREHTRSYLAAGGTQAFSEYYTANYGYAFFRPRLRENVVFSAYNLVTDSSFNEFNVILCRNVMIYFNRDLQNRVLGVLHGSLVSDGILGLGRRESLRFTPHETCYRPVEEKEGIYRRVE